MPGVRGEHEADAPLFKWRQEDLATQCHVSKGVIANIESFQRAPLVEHGLALDDAFGFKDMFAKAAREIHGEAFPEPFVDFARHESEADMLLTYQACSRPSGTREQ